jgi:hypothetical protein
VGAQSDDTEDPSQTRESSPRLTCPGDGRRQPRDGQVRIGRAAARNAGLLPVGSRAPSFALETPEGKTVGLSSLRGRAVLLEPATTR